MLTSARDDKFKVVAIRDTILTFPELWLDVYIQGDDMEQRAFAPMFSRSHCSRAKTIEEADLVVFTGGEDVNPALYHEEPHKTTTFSKARDSADTAAYLRCLEAGIPMFGVCRGAQFLHVMNGGKLYQHVDEHTGAHPMFDVDKRRTIDKVSSVHHQMCIQNVKGGMKILATSAKSRERWHNPTKLDKGPNPDVEAFFYRETGCLGVQGHPEYGGYHAFTKWCLDAIQESFQGNEDFEFVGEKGHRHLRMKADLVALRGANRKSIITGTNGE